MRIKMDYNNLLSTIDRTLSESRSRTVKANAFGIAVGLELLSGYLRDIAQRAIDLNDDKLIDLCVDMGILKQEGEK
jgi:hypothetical protein|nr:MAG TPA: hypothetical protein [Caudoviricetes sp.]